jgi:MoaA/NifB/PqqE/SkfB family radical SAM enzyme
MLASRVRGAPVLVAASLYTTHRCNLRCLYCSSPFRETDELGTEQWLSIVDELAELGCQRVGILGGEPLLRRDTPDIIERVHDRGMSCVLTSNGTLVAKHVHRLRRLDTLVLSLDAVGEATDEVRGAGVYESVRRAVRAARAHGIPIKLNAVLSAKTAPGLDEMIRFVEENDLSITFNAMRSGDPDLWRDAATIKDEDEAIRRTLERVAALARTNPRVLFAETSYRYAARWGDYSRDRAEAHELASDDPRLEGAPRCQAGRYYMAIDPDGTVYPCPVTSGKLPGGNVVRDGVENAWKQLHDHPCVACYSPCLVEQNFLYSLHPPVLAHFVRRYVTRYS